MHRLKLLPSALALLVLCLPAGAEEPAPFTASLQGNRVEFEIDNVKLEIAFMAGAEPVLKAESLVEGVEPAAILDVTGQGGTITVSTLDQAESRTRDLALQVLLNPTQALGIRGSELDLNLRKEIADEESTETDANGELEIEPEEQQSEPDSAEEQPTATPAEGPGSLPLAIDVVASEAVLDGVRGGSVSMEDGTLLATGCHGRFDITGSHTVVEIRDHVGSLSLGGRDNEFTVTDGVGQIEIELEGGELFGRQGRGAVSGRAIDSRVQLDEWNGAASLTGEGTSIEIRRSQGVRVIASGERLDVLIDQWRGGLTARLFDGSLRAEGLQGAAEVTARDGTSVDLIGVKGRLTLNLGGSSTATVSRVTGELKATVNDGYLEANELDTISVVAQRSRVDLAAVRKINQLKVTDGELDADLTGIRGTSTIALRGASRGEIQLTKPCLVWTLGPGGHLGAGATLSGCDHRLTGQRKRRRSRTLEGRRQMQLKLMLDADARANVTGYP